MVRILLTTIGLLFAVSVFAADLHVGAGQTYTTVASAITASVSTDVIIIHAGTYVEYNLIPKANTTLIANDGDEPVIDGQQYAYVGGYDNNVIRIRGDDITIDGLTLKNGGKGVIEIDDTGRDGTTIQNNKMYMTEWTGYATDNAGIIYMYAGHTNTTIQNNYIETAESGVHGMILYQGVGLTTISNNEIRVSSTYEGSKRSAGILWKHNLFTGSAPNRALIENNFIVVTGHAQNDGMYINHENVDIENNLVIGTNRFPIKVGVSDTMGTNDDGSGCTGDHNTMYGAFERSGPDWYAGGPSTDTTWTNNIFHNMSTAPALEIWKYASSGTHNTTLNYNNYYHTGSAPIGEFDTDYTLSAWKAYYGQDANSVSEDSGFSDGSGNLNLISDFEIVSGSANNGSSTGTDIGVDVTIVGLTAAAGGGGGSGSTAAGSGNIVQGSGSCQ